LEAKKWLVYLVTNGTVAYVRNAAQQEMKDTTGQAAYVIIVKLNVRINGKNAYALFVVQQETKDTTGMEDASVIVVVRQGIKSTPGIVTDQVFVGHATKNANINGMDANALSVEKLGTKAMITLPVWAHAEPANRK